MADCDSPTLSVPDLTCAADLPTWGTALIATLQAALDHIVGCVQDFEYPACDICVLKDDLPNCPLTVDMIDFTGATYAETGGVGVLPQPETLVGFAFRVGTGVTLETMGDGVFASFAVTFDEAFDTECLHVSITPTHISGVVPGGSCVGDTIALLGGWYVLTKTTTGFTGEIAGAELDCEALVHFTYLAVGN